MEEPGGQHTSLSVLLNLDLGWASVPWGEVLTILLMVPTVSCPHVTLGITRFPLGAFTRSAPAEGGGAAALPPEILEYTPAPFKDLE